MGAERDFRFEGVVRLTRIGGGYLAFTLIVGFAALNTGNNSLYMTLAIMLATLLVSGLASKSGLRRIEIEVVSVGEAWAKRPVEALVRLDNRSRIWRVRDVVVTAPSVPKPTIVSDLPKRHETYVPMTFVFDRRGKARFNVIDLYTRYPFGLFVKKRRVRLSGDAIVYPELVDDPPDRRLLESSRGDHSPHNRPGPGNEIYAFREYSRGDSLRSIHWKRSAGLGRWIIKQHQEDTAQTVSIAIDPYLPAGRSREEFERMISEAATFVDFALGAGFHVIFHLESLTLAGRDPETRRGMLEALALVEPIPESENVPFGSDTVTFSLRGGYDAKSA